MAPPLIAVTTSETREGGGPAKAEADPERREMVLGMKYLEAVRTAGGIPIVVPPLDGDGVEALLDRVDGLCLSGGPDLTPEIYGAEPHAELGPTELSLDRTELALAASADRRGKPILAICRGLQLLNVSRGGTLHQHLPDLVGDAIMHRQETSGVEVTHSVRVAPGSRLASLIGGETVDVNSFHHQAVDRLGDQLVATAWAPDDVVEGIEDPGRRFVVGVQWHAESLTARPEHAALFAALVEEAR